MAQKFNWTFPNLGKYYSKIPPIRGTLSDRLADASRLNISRIELPFDLVRKENDEYLTLGKKKEILSKKMISMFCMGEMMNLMAST